MMQYILSYPNKPQGLTVQSYLKHIYCLVWRRVYQQLNTVLLYLLASSLLGLCQTDDELRGCINFQYRIIIFRTLNNNLLYWSPRRKKKKRPPSRHPIKIPWAKVSKAAVRSKSNKTDVQPLSAAKTKRQWAVTRPKL